MIDYSQVGLRDVTLRDGLQLTGKVLDVDVRVKLARTLLAAGVPELEIGSMARPPRSVCPGLSVLTNTPSTM